MRWKFPAIVLLLVLLLTLFPTGSASAECTDVWVEPPGEFVTTCSDDDGGGGGSTPCTPGEGVEVIGWVPFINDLCEYYRTIVDSCTGAVLGGPYFIGHQPCPTPQPAAQNPCTDFTIGPGVPAVSTATPAHGVCRRGCHSPKSIWTCAPSRPRWCAGRPLSAHACSPIPALARCPITALPAARLVPPAWATWLTSA